MANMAQAIRMALHYAEENLGVTDVFGEDVGPPLGGVFTATQGLKTAWNSPLDERGIIGCAIGLALAGQRPVAEIQFCDYIFNTIDLLKIAGNTHWASNGDWNVPMVVRTPVGSGIVKLKYGPATGFDEPRTWASLSAKPAYQTQRSIDRSTSSRPEQSSANSGIRDSIISAMR